MNSNPEKPLMTQAQYARHRNTSPQYIGKLAKAGVLVMRGRLVDAVACDSVLDDKPAERPAPESQQSPTNYAQAKLADMVFRAKLRRLEFETRQGRLIKAAIVKERWAVTEALGHESDPTVIRRDVGTFAKIGQNLHVRGQPVELAPGFPLSGEGKRKQNQNRNNSHTAKS